MNFRRAILTDMKRLLELFGPHCTDRETLDWLSAAVSNRAQWQRAHGVFNEIRRKTLKAAQRGSEVGEAQYLFEEVCAKTLYNLSRLSAPFDPDSPYWIVPSAIALARCIGIDEAAVLARISIQRPPPSGA